MEERQLRNFIGKHAGRQNGTLFLSLQCKLHIYVVSHGLLDNMGSRADLLVD
jgi:hypothetical protein